MERRKVMIIDDEEDFLAITKKNLEETGHYAVATISNAKNILEELHTVKPDVILLDIMMPHVGGIEACQMLNDDEVGRTTPIIVISALDKFSDKLKVYKLGVVDYLIKPVEFKDIISCIEKALQFK